MKIYENTDGANNDKEQELLDLIHKTKEQIMMDQVAVVCTYSFDTDAAIYFFDDQEEAIEWLRETVLEQYKIDTEENGWDALYEISDDGMYGVIKDFFFDHDDITEYHVGYVFPTHKT